MKLNVLPCPMTLLTQMCPPCISTNERVIESPRPVPEISWVRAVEARKKRVNSLA